MDAAFQRAASAQTFRVLGLPLRPLTLGHLFLLHEHESAYVREAAPAADDLILSVLICAQPHRHAKRLLTLRPFRPFFWAFLKLWGFQSRRLNWIHEARKFQAYLEHHQTLPAIRRAPGVTEVRTLGAPEHWSLLTMLMIDFHMSEAEALDTPLLKAHLLWATQAEREGSIEFAWNSRLEEFWEIARRMDAEAQHSSPSSHSVPSN